MLEVNHLVKRYKGTTAVDDVSFKIETGRVGILLGPNGAGKSTIIKCIASLLKYKGDIQVQGNDSRSVAAKQVLGYVPEIPVLYDSLSVLEHMEFIQRAYGCNDEGYVPFLLERFELGDKRDRIGNELSKGMKQKVSICCALLIHPKVILLDEPMVGLDPKAIKVLRETILDLKADGVTILISTHMLDMVKDIWDDMFVMDHGKLIGNYRREDVKDQEIEELFFTTTEREDVVGGSNNE